MGKETGAVVDMHCIVQRPSVALRQGLPRLTRYLVLTLHIESLLAVTGAVLFSLFFELTCC